MTQEKNVDFTEVAKFKTHSPQWWTLNGPLRTLHEINPTRVQFIQKFIDLKNTPLLDVGCGGGILAESLASLGAKVTGIDACEEAIEIAKAHAHEMKLQIDYQTCLIEDFPDTTFDAIMCLEMLEHVQNPGLIIAECAKRLAPGGKLFLSTINRSLKAYLTAIIGAEYLLNLLPKQTHDYNKFIKPSELAKMIRDAGLELIQLKGLHYNPILHTANLTEDVSVNYLLVCEKH